MTGVAYAATPGAPTITGVSFSSLGATVTWTAPAAVGGVTVIGYVAAAGTGGPTCTVTSTASPVSCTIPSFAPATSVTFSVYAESNGGNGTAGTFAQTTPSLSTSPVTLGGFPLSPQNVGAAITFVADVPLGATGTVNFELGGATITDCGTQLVTSGYALCTTNTLVSAARAVVLAGLNSFQNGARILREVSALGYVLAQQTVRVLVAFSLPR